MSELYGEVTHYMPVQLYPDFAAGIKWASPPTLDAAGLFKGTVEGFVRGQMPTTDGRVIPINCNFLEQHLDIQIASRLPNRSKKFAIPTNPNEPHGGKLPIRFIWIQCSAYYDLQERQVIDIAIRFKPQWRSLSGLDSWFIARASGIANPITAAQGEDPEDEE